MIKSQNLLLRIIITVTPTTASVTSSSNISNLLPNASITTVTSSPIAPSEVSPTTAISDRPKVKSVSKKDSKNNRKAVAAAAAAAAAAASSSTSTASSISAIQPNPAFVKVDQLKPTIATTNTTTPLATNAMESIPQIQSPEVQQVLLQK